MSKNYFTFLLIVNKKNKYGDISDDVSDGVREWAVMCAVLIGKSQLQTETELEPFCLSLVSAKTNPKGAMTHCVYSGTCMQELNIETVSGPCKIRVFDTLERRR